MKIVTIKGVEYQIINGHTYSFNSGEVYGQRPFDDLKFSSPPFVLVYVNAEGLAIVESYMSIEKILNSRRNMDLVYRYVAIKEDNPKFIIEDKILRKIFIVRNIKEMGNQWTLYSNSKGGIVARQEFINAKRPEKLVGENLCFYCSYGLDRFIYLSSVQFVLKNTELTEPVEVNSQRERYLKRINNTTVNN